MCKVSIRSETGEDPQSSSLKWWCSVFCFISCSFRLSCGGRFCPQYRLLPFGLFHRFPCSRLLWRTRVCICPSISSLHIASFFLGFLAFCFSFLSVQPHSFMLFSPLVRLWFIQSFTVQSLDFPTLSSSPSFSTVNGSFVKWSIYFVNITFEDRIYPNLPALLSNY